MNSADFENFECGDFEFQYLLEESSPYLKIAPYAEVRGCPDSDNIDVDFEPIYYLIGMVRNLYWKNSHQAFSKKHLYYKINS